MIGRCFTKLTRFNSPDTFLILTAHPILLRKVAMPKFNVARSTVVNAPLETVKASLCDYKQWPRWSPWLICEPDAGVEYSDLQGGVGASYQWSGDLIGAGGMELASVTDEQLDMQLNFLKPFKSQARVVFELKAQGDSTEVTWSMYSSLPFFLFFMIKQMKVWIGMDYERGLRMFKEYIETGTVVSSLTIDGVEDRPSTPYLGFANSCSFDDINTVMTKDFERLMEYVGDNNPTLNSPPFVIYNTFDLVKQHTQYIVCISTEGVDISVPEGMVAGELAHGKALKVTHSGKYEHLGNAWAAAMSYTRAKKLKPKKSPVGVEVYLNSPQNTAESELLTQVFVPLR